MAAFCPITLDEFEDFILPLGFRRIALDGTLEYVYGKRLDCGSHPVTVRVYSGIDIRDDKSREVGSDAIRVCMVGKGKRVGDDGIERDHIFGLAKDRRVHRVAGWRKNLAARLDSCTCGSVKTCKKCGAPLAYSAKKDRFYCSDLCWTN